MPIYRRPEEIAGYNFRRHSPGRLLGRELTWSVVLGALTGAVLLFAGRDAWTFAAAVLIAAGVACGGWIAEAVFYHRIGTRLPDPFSPGAYLARAGLWAGLGGFGVWLGGGLLMLAGVRPFPAVVWLLGGAVLSVLIQAPLRLRHRRRAEEKLWQIRP